MWQAVQSEDGGREVGEEGYGAGAVGAVVVAAAVVVVGGGGDVGVES